MAGPYGSVGTDYRELQSPEQVNTDLPDSGGAARAAALGSLFREFEGISSDVGTKVQTQAGALAGAASGATGHPQYKEGLARLTTYSQAFNNAATGAYAVEAEAQADDAAARLRVQANNNPATFQATYSAVRDGVLKNAPAMAVPMLTELYNKHLAAGLAAISGDQAAQQQQLQRQTYDEGVSRQTSRVAELQGQGKYAEAEDEHVKLSLMITGGFNSGLYSEAEAKAMNVISMRTITAQVFQTQVDKELARPDGDVVTLLDNFRKAHEANLADTNAPPILSEPEYQKLMADATTKIREQNMLVAMNKREGKTAEQLKFEAGDQQYTSMLLQGRLTPRALAVATANGDLKPETARALRSQMLNENQPIKSDANVLLRLHTDPGFLDKSDIEIASTPGINAIDALSAINDRNKRNGSWEGTQAVKDAKGTISAALKIPPGTSTMALSDDQRKGLTDATQEFIQLQQGTDPSKRDGLASQNAQIAVKHAQDRITDGEVQSLTLSRQSAQRNHGPGSADEWSDDKMKAYLKQKDDAIATLRSGQGK